jgi:hypothetical protein
VSRKLPLSCDFGSEVLWRGPLPTRKLGGGPIFCRIGFTPTGMPRPCTHSRTNSLTGLSCVGGPTDGIFREVSQYARDIAVFEDKEGVYFITEDVGPAYGNSTVYVDRACRFSIRTEHWCKGRSGERPTPPLRISFRFLTTKLDIVHTRYNEQQALPIRALTSSRIPITVFIS